MNKVLYSIVCRIPLIGPVYKIYSKPMFCSSGIADGMYDDALKVIENHHSKYPNEVITKHLIKRLLKERSMDGELK